MKLLFFPHSVFCDVFVNWKLFVENLATEVGRLGD